MAKLTMKLLHCLVFLGALQPVASYHYVGDCVPGGIVAGLSQTKGLIGLYTVALQRILPFIKDLKLLAAGPNNECLAAADSVNSNAIMSEEGHVKGVLKKFPEMKEVGLGGVLKKGNVSQSYLYVFDLKSWGAHEYLGRCIPGVVVKNLNVTEGKLGPYSEALQLTAESVYGKLMATASTDSFPECEHIIAKINAGNSTLRNKIIHEKLDNVTAITPKEREKMTANENKTYMFVFKNKAWNTTSDWWI
eukprot:TRINITY_DN2458_c0_g2_i1.p1 TRINITY_DN2458_c0_g2~~TRINITY_DN2458_c0_g2_i1.p1  ORF type:complete len:248 (+),score=47.35 TRINITY_DN2458_c0_g2_i1:71-814(+)